MVHSVIVCDNCGSQVMEGRNTWECDFGWVWPPKKEVKPNTESEDE